MLHRLYIPFDGEKQQLHHAYQRYDITPGIRAITDDSAPFTARPALGVHLKIVRGALIPDWLRDRSSPHFRYCAKCLRRGYHGVVHRLNSVDECPIHCEALQVGCPSCDRSTPYVLNARLLDALF